MTLILEVDLIEDGNIRPMFDAEKVTQIFSRPECQDIPFLVVSINGTKNSGKSFLCNLMICFLENLSKVS